MIYVSSATVRLSQAELLALLTLSRANNQARGLTGMLLYRDGMYLQYLEGRREAVGALLARIKKDRRHKGIRILREGNLPERLFPEWSMAYKNLAGLRSDRVPGYSEVLQGQYGSDPSRVLTRPNPEQLLLSMFNETLIGI